MPLVDLRVLLQPEHRHNGDRLLRAAVATLKTCGELLGAFPQPSLTLVDPPWRSAPLVADDVVVMERVPWWTTPGSMTPELAVGRAISRRFLRKRIDIASLPAWFVDGLVEYLARRAVTDVFAIDNTAPGYAFLEQRYFGGFVPGFVRIRLDPERGGPTTLLILGSLERWVGRPIFDQVITEFASGSPPRPTLEDFARTASAVSGQDLSWLFDEALRPSATFDYGIERLTSEPQADGSFTTELVVRRFGDARFTGSSAAPIARYESGRGIGVRVAFDDGQSRTDAWDGRAVEKAFRYRSAVRAVSAVVDPDHVVVLDVHRTNNSLSMTPRAGAAASRWAIRWMAWLEHALLNYGALV